MTPRTDMQVRGICDETKVGHERVTLTGGKSAEAGLPFPLLEEGGSVEL